MTPAALQLLAERQWRDYQASTPGTWFAESNALDLDDAYRLQDAVARLRVAAGDRLIGFKVGCTGAGTVAQFGMAGPIRGLLFQSEVRHSGASIDIADHASPAIEGEMAFRIGADGEPDAAFPVIELHNFVFRGERKTLSELVANNGLQAGVVLPAAIDGWRQTHVSMTVRLNDTVIGEGPLWPLPGGARGSFAWLRDHLRCRGMALAPGDLVLAGTELGLYPVGAGDCVEVALDGTPSVECIFIAQ